MRAGEKNYKIGFELAQRMSVEDASEFNLRGDKFTNISSLRLSNKGNTTIIEFCCIVKLYSGAVVDGSSLYLSHASMVSVHDINSGQWI